MGSKGRPRSEDINKRILDATTTMLAECGYTGMSIESIARRAMVSKATIYLRYKNKAVLASSAVAAVWEIRSVPNTGTVHGDLVALLRGSAPMMNTPLGAPFIGALLAEELHNPAGIRIYREAIILARYRMYRTVLERGVERGEIRRDADLDIAYEMLTGWWYAHHLLGKEVDNTYLSELVQELLCGIGSGA